MNKKLLLSVLSLMILSSVGSTCFAFDSDCPNPTHPMGMGLKQHKMQPKYLKQKPPRGEFKQNKISPEKRAQMEAKRAEFEKRLNLTDEQKQTIEANKIKDREKMAPIMREIREKQRSFRTIDANTNLSQDQKQKEKQKVKSEIRALKLQADKCRQENMKSFENTLTPKQKSEFEKIKKEQRQEMEKKRIEHIEKMEKFHKERLKDLQEAKKNPPEF